MSIFAQPQTELPPELLGFTDNFVLPEACINIDQYLLDPNDFFYSGNCDSLLPCLSSIPSDNLNSTSAPESVPVFQELDSFLYPKRQKICDNEEVYLEWKPNSLNGLVPNSYLSHQEVEIPPPLPVFLSTGSSVYSSESCESVKKPPADSSLSAQSIAARQRRRKITEKTQELGKLIRGGQKMNTAEMFQAAYKYIKFLQAQVGILELMTSNYQENDEPLQSEELHALIESPLIQEKLYSTENCMVPQKFVQALESDNQIQSNPRILEEIKQLLPSS